MNRGCTGRYQIQTTLGESVRAFIPTPLPPDRQPAHVVRVPPAVHRNLVMQAAESGVGLNRIAEAKLTGISP